MTTMSASFSLYPFFSQPTTFRVLLLLVVCLLDKFLVYFSPPPPSVCMCVCV